MTTNQAQTLDIQHSFIATVDNVTIKVNGYFDYEGDYEIEHVYVGDDDIALLLSDNVKQIIQKEAGRTLEQDLKVIEAEKVISSKYGY